MILEIQSSIEDFISDIGGIDKDGYASTLARLLYENLTLGQNFNDFLKIIDSEKTTFFYNNVGIKKSIFLSSLYRRIIRKYKKKLPKIDATIFNDSIAKIETWSRITILSLLNDFKAIIESRAVDQFWISRKAENLQSYPEKIGQANLSVFFSTIFRFFSKGYVFREFSSGIGFVDIGVVFSSSLHIIELKIFKDDLIGINQLANYMKLENRKFGYLVLFDARTPQNKKDVPKKIEVENGTILIILIDINPPTPSSLN